VNSFSHKTKMASTSHTNFFLLRFWTKYDFLLINKCVQYANSIVHFWCTKHTFFTFYERSFFYRFSGRIRTFYRSKTDLYEKKFPSLCYLPWFHGCPNENFVRLTFERCYQVRDFSFWITEGIGLTGVALIRIFGFFFTFTWNFD
jgi:hypothetical protein